MSTRRTITLRDGRFQVSNDPDDVLGYLLNCFTSKSLVGEAAQRFRPDGPGLSLYDTVLAVRAGPIDFAELPLEQVPADLDREWWWVSLERPHGEPGPPAVVIIEGDELRDLLRAADLWST